MNSLKIYLIKTKNSKVYCIRCEDTLQPIVDTNKKLYGNVLDVSNVSSKKELEKMVEKKGTIKNFKNDIVYCGDNNSKEFKESKHKIKIHIGSPQDEIKVKKSKTEEEKPETVFDILPPEILGQEILQYVSKSDLLALMATNTTLFLKFKDFFLNNSYFDINDFLEYKEVNTNTYELYIKESIQLGGQTILRKEINNLIIKNPKVGVVAERGTIKFTEDKNLYTIDYNLEEVKRIYPLNVLKGFVNVKRLKLNNPNRYRSDNPNRREINDLNVREFTFFKELSSLKNFDKNSIKEIYYNVSKYSEEFEEDYTDYEFEEPEEVDPYIPIEFMYEEGNTYLPNNLEVLKLPITFDGIIFKLPYLSEKTRNEIETKYGKEYAKEEFSSSVFPKSLEYLDMRTEPGYNGDVNSLIGLMNLKFLAFNLFKKQHLEKLPPNIETLIYISSQPVEKKINFNEYKKLTSLELHRYSFKLTGSVLPANLKKLNLQLPYDLGKEGELENDPFPKSLEEFTIFMFYRTGFDFRGLQKGIRKLTIQNDSGFSKNWYDLPRSLQYLYYSGIGFDENLDHLKNLRKLVIEHGGDFDIDNILFSTNNFPENLEDLDIKISGFILKTKQLKLTLPKTTKKLKIRIVGPVEYFTVFISGGDENLFVEKDKNIKLEFLD